MEEELLCFNSETASSISREDDSRIRGSYRGSFLTMWPWKKEKPPELERRIKVNNAEYNLQFGYATNYISTSKYNVFTFLPKNLFEQFRRLANSYFLILLILQFIPPISSLTPLTTLIPMVAVLAITALKDLVDDVQRHRSDNQVNNRISSVLRDGQMVEEKWHKVVVGDIIRMENNQFVAADLYLLSTSEPNSLCYIETAELDGETNLKVRQALIETAEMGDDLEQLSKLNVELVCEAPNNRLNKFQGTMKWKDQNFALDNNHILLRGCVLRNTRWCYGVVVFAGCDTKLMMNSGKSVFKRTHIDRLMNVLIVGIFGFLMSMCLICTVACGVWETVTGYRFQTYLPWERFVPGSTIGDKQDSKTRGATIIAVLVFLSYIIILNTVVPISLYVSVEMIRFAHSLMINWDVKMYYEKADTPAKCRTTTLNEELGQIEYIFSDKTGTLTQNIMTFNKCSIDGKYYGDYVNEPGKNLDVGERGPRIDLSQNQYAEKSFMFSDYRLIEEIRRNNPKVWRFFRLLALCHTVMPEMKETGLEYQAQSPDENALVSAARNFGFVFTSRTPNTITIEVNGTEETYELLCILDFNNVRKRMSVIVQKDGVIQLLCKGADTLVFTLLSPESNNLKELTVEHLNQFAQDGLRTLCLAAKEIEPQVYADWKKRHHEASISLENRDDKLNNLFEEIEKNLTLLGATAIEDKLQDGVPETIANLALAGIKIWVLTGDKQETAINIGYSCKLLTDEMEEIFIVDGEEYDEVQDQLKKSLQHINNYCHGSSCFGNGNMYEDVDGATFGKEIEPNQYALVINGHSLIHALEKSMESLLLEVGCLCKAVICCRVTPLQKARVVDLVKRNKKSVTLAIGDGANDVSMIKMAHIGVGISGQEGMQAVLASDYALSQFRYLERLLLVHGRWSYLRMCKFLKYFFYKNFAFTLCHFWYAFFCGFSAQTLYDPYFISLYNVFYTSLPVLAMAMFDQDVDEYYSIKYPKLYTPGHKNLLFNKKLFLWSVAEGIVSSLILFFIPYGAFGSSVNSQGHDTSDHQSLGVVVASTLVVAVNLRCAIDTSYWTAFNHIFIWGSIIFFFCFTFAFYSDLFEYTYQGVAVSVFSTTQYIFCLILTCGILLVPILAYRFYTLDTNPTLSDRVRLKQRMTKTKSRSQNFNVGRQSTIRRSQRSMRSGYAFAHQEGFGQLITSGLNMRSRVQSEAGISDKSSIKLKGITRLSSTTGEPIHTNSGSFNAIRA
ncbi:phospholipid-transporting ATPase ID isoform X2 [Octopus sinensis]|uniref:Phospholipid-transporting ATPase n=1 Tax=Octopus sinensis TaxID=2607531 RepID=A0A6P7TJC5_9MOLL|nr:phospholipid-transporting ATPase ID isoform X2 [Octopus sinensis]